MKYCLSGRQTINKLKQYADEIKVQYSDKGFIYDLIDQCQEKTIILSLPYGETEPIDWQEIHIFAKNYIGDFICGIHDLAQYEECKQRSIKFYFDYPVTSYYELQAMKDMGVSYIVIGIPLFFDLDNVSKFNIPIRTVPNMSYLHYLERANGVCGQWIRPEDQDFYEQYIQTFEFNSINPTQEMTIYKIYAQDKRWPGDLQTLIPDLGISCFNSATYEGLAEARANCRHKCQLASSSCHFCENALRFSEVIKKYAKHKKEN